MLEELLGEHARERMLIFTADNATVYQIARRYLVPAITHQTKAKERKQILERFHSGEYPVVVTSQVLNEGVDVPAASVGHRALGQRQHHGERAAARPHPAQARRQAGRRCTRWSRGARPRSSSATAAGSTMPSNEENEEDFTTEDTEGTQAEKTQNYA